ncbi:MAG: serine/threonine protein kinase, partial [Limisphaerales bacterium]
MEQKELMRQYIPINERIEHAEFKTLNLIDEGGMGSIVEVEEAQTGRPVALKVMHPEMMNSEEAVDRFYLEAKVLARLEHPNIVPLHVLKLDRERRPFYTMKKVQGRTLQGIISGLRKGDAEIVAEFPLDRLMTVFHKICDAMAFAHSKGIVHRDLKPANIMVGEFGEVLVMDWGLAKVVGEPERVATTEEIPGLGGIQDDLEKGSMTISAAAGALTREGAVMGTPQYMAPEQATGRISDIDERSDVFALGGILYALITLHPPFFGKDVRDILSRVARADVENPMTFMNEK